MDPDPDLIELSNALPLVDEMYQRFLNKEDIDPSWVALFGERAAARVASGGNGSSASASASTTTSTKSGNGNGRGGNGGGTPMWSAPAGDDYGPVLSRAAIGAPPLAVPANARMGS